MNKKHNILVLGARAPIALELARSFYRYGAQVVLADSLRMPVGRWSNSIVKYERLPSPRYNSTEYVEAITRLVSVYSIQHIIPTCEEAFYIARYKHNWRCKVWVSDIKLMNLLHNKESFEQEFRNQLPIPETISVDQFSGWEQSKQYVFKPKYSRFGSQLFIDETITKDTISAPKKWIAQKKVYGNEICIYSVWDEGKLKAYTSYTPLLKVGKGSGVFFRSFENEAIKEQVKRFGEANNYTGQLSFDAIVSDGNAWFIECNPRGTSGAHLLNDHLAACFLNKQETVSESTHDYMLTSLMFFTHPLKFLFKRVRKARGVIFRLNDPMPALLQVLSLMEIISIKFAKGIDLLQATTFDIEWNGDED